MVDKKDDISVKNLLIKSQTNSSIKKLTIESDIMNGYLEGDYNFKDLIAASTNNFVTYLPSFQNPNDAVVKINNDFNFNITIFNSELLSKLFFEGISLSKNT